MNGSRRQFVKQTLATSIGFTGLGLMLDRRLAAGWLHDQSVPGYGPLIPDPDAIIDLPAGFDYQILSKAGDTMNDGLLVPGKHDGMAAFHGPMRSRWNDDTRSKSRDLPGGIAA